MFLYDGHTGDVKIMSLVNLAMELHSPLMLIVSMFKKMCVNQIYALDATATSWFSDRRQRYY